MWPFKISSMLLRDLSLFSFLFSIPSLTALAINNPALLRKLLPTVNPTAQNIQEFSVKVKPKCSGKWCCQKWHFLLATEFPKTDSTSRSIRNKITINVWTSECGQRTRRTSVSTVQAVLQSSHRWFLSSEAKGKGNQSQQHNSCQSCQHHTHFSEEKFPRPFSQGRRF